jgi:hypothetical protein
MSAVLDCDHIRRRLALNDTIDHARRAASAAAAASSGESDAQRAAVLADSIRRLRGVIRELQELA